MFTPCWSRSRALLPTPRWAAVWDFGQRPAALGFEFSAGRRRKQQLPDHRPSEFFATGGDQEYRISTNNFSAEYGRTSGFLANAITRSGSNEFHGDAYFYLRTTLLNANDFQQNLNGAPRPPDKQSNRGTSSEGRYLRTGFFS